MSRLTMQLFFSLLALVALSGFVLLISARLVGRWVGPLRSFEELVAPSGIWLAWLVAAVSTAGSLYFSEIAELRPCQLCWYQRYAMYPLVVVLPLAAATGSRWLRRYGLLSAGVGAAIAAWHYLVEWFPDLEPSNVCSITVPCTQPYFRRMGFVTIAFMALCGFLAILSLLTARSQES